VEPVGFNRVVHVKFNMARSVKIVVDALNSFAKSNIRGHVDESDLRVLIDDYFGGSDDVESELSNEDRPSDNDAQETGFASAEFELNRSDSEADEADDESLVTVSEVQAVLGRTGEQIPDWHRWS
jgi:hypothetical protein